MTPDEARAVLGLEPSAPIELAVEHHRRLQRQFHPDLRGGSDRAATERSALLNEALAVLRRASARGPQTSPPDSEDDRITPPRPDHPLDLEVSRHGETIFLTAPPDETYLRLLEASAGLGGIGHVDPRLGLLEVIVRFEGGPSCSVLFTLQGRANGTEVLCEMESIEARPTPPIEPVLSALEQELRTSAAHPPPPSPF